MTQRIGIWSLRQSDEGREQATPLEELHSTETEQRFEALLVEAPDVLVPGLRLIGRQVQTSGGPLDLLGVDPDGRIVLFELKRGTLTRDAVAQLLDYASDLLERDAEDFANLIESSSGRLGIDKIDDFAEWFSNEFTDVAEPDLDDIRMFLVGLGVDERARRIVNLLARSQVDIQLLTFQAFRRGPEVLLARQVETVEPRSRSTSGRGLSKEEGRRLLNELAREQGVQELLIEVADFVAGLMPRAYRWPHKTAFGFSMSDVTEEGKPSNRSYATVTVDQKTRGRVIFELPDRAVEAASAAVHAIVEAQPAAKLTSRSWKPFELPITSESWEEMKQDLGQLVQAVVAGWERRMAELEASSEVRSSSTEE